MSAMKRVLRVHDGLAIVGTQLWLAVGAAVILVGLLVAGVVTARVAKA